MNRQALDRAAQAQLFTAARTVNQWQDRAVDEKTLHELYELAKWAPTSMNSAPARLVFVVGADAKARLAPALAGGNVERMMNAPATIIVASDPHFYEHLPTLFPAYPTARDMYAENQPWAAETAFRNSSMQGAYLILAARALGLDCGPMSGFDNAKVDEAFFSEGRFAGSGYRSNFLLNIGYGIDDSVFPRGARLSFEQAAVIL